MTLREHLEAIRDRCPADTMPLTAADAVAALAILDASERDCFDHDKATNEHRWVRLVPDPEKS